MRTALWKIRLSTVLETIEDRLKFFGKIASAQTHDREFTVTVDTSVSSARSHDKHPIKRA